jgi:hypothetical protein
MRACPGIDRCSRVALLLASIASIVGTEIDGGAIAAAVGNAFSTVSTIEVQMLSQNYHPRTQAKINVLRPYANNGRTHSRRQHDGRHRRASNTRSQRAF